MEDRIVEVLEACLEEVQDEELLDEIQEILNYMYSK